jgi:hypothetical protein
MLMGLINQDTRRHIPYISISQFSFQSKQKSAFIIKNSTARSGECEELSLAGCDAV